MTTHPWQMTPQALRRRAETPRVLHVVAYDIADDRRRRRVARVAEGLGHRTQQSVFLSNLAPEDLARARRRFAQIIDHAEDTVILVPIADAELSSLGKPIAIRRPRLVIA
jgi:CRISPR-associated protein Cas2